MLRDMLSFRGRIGRLRYSVLSTALSVFVALLVVVMALTTVVLNSALAVDLNGGFASLVFVLVIVVAGAMYVWSSLSLAAKRFRDIGWYPLYAFVGWTVVLAGMILIVIMSPPGYEHLLGLMANAIYIALLGCLLLWPGTADAGGHRDAHSANGVLARM